MSLQSNGRFRELQNYENALSEVKFRCKCGHRTVIPKCAEKQICGWCGKYVFRDKKVEFEYIEKLENQVDEQDRLIEELKTELEELKDKLEHEIQYRQDNFKPISEMELYGLNENDYC